MSKFMQHHNFTNNKHSNKKVKKIEESRIIFQSFHSYFHHVLFTNNCYYLYLKKPRFNYCYFLTHISSLTGDIQWTKCHSLLWLSLIKIGIQHLAMDLCVFPRQVMVLKKVFPLNSDSVRVEYKQILQSYVG